MIRVSSIAAMGMFAVLLSLLAHAAAAGNTVGHMLLAIHVGLLIAWLASLVAVRTIGALQVPYDRMRSQHTSRYRPGCVIPFVLQRIIGQRDLGMGGGLFHVMRTGCGVEARAYPAIIGDMAWFLAMICLLGAGGGLPYQVNKGANTAERAFGSLGAIAFYAGAIYVYTRTENAYTRTENASARRKLEKRQRRALAARGDGEETREIGDGTHWNNEEEQPWMSSGPTMEPYVVTGHDTGLQ